MVTEKIGVAIIGCGMISDFHLKALSGVPEYQIIGVWDRNPARMRHTAERYGVKSYDSFDELLRDPKVTMADICLASGLHGQFGTAAAIAGKHVVVEKPIDTTLEAARRMINACHEQRTTLSVIFPYRFTPLVAQVKAALDQGMLGRLIAAEATIKWYREPAYYESSPWKGRKRLDGGGALINQSIHYIDLLLWMMGDVKKVTSLVRTAVHKIEVEDLAMALVEFESGAIGSVTGATALKPGFPERLEIYGERGAIAIEAGRIVR